MMVVMTVVMAAAGAVLIMLMVVMMMLMLLVVMIMAAAVIVIVVMMVVMLVFVLIVLVMVVMVVLILVIVILVVMVVMMVLMLMLIFLSFQALGFQPGQFSGKGCLALHGRNQLLTGQLAPGCGDNGGHRVVLPQNFHGGIQFGLGDRIGPGQDDGGSSLHLVVVEFTEVLGVDLDFSGVHNGNGVAQGYVRAGDLVHSADYVGQLAHAGGFNDNPVGVVLVNDLRQSLAKVAYQGAADAAGIHLRNVDAGVLQKAAVNADLAKLILNQHQLLSLVAFRDHLLDQRGFTSAQEAGININLCHK